MKALLIGRHAGEIPGIEIVEQRNVQFPPTAQKCRTALRELKDDALALGADALVFQAMPGQLAIALAQCSYTGQWLPRIEIGIVISKPGSRPAAKTYDFSDRNPYVRASAKRLAEFCNPNAKLEDDGSYTLRATVDQPMRFEFSHIEWL
jgi:hypothetical protein